jgi:hypothetical protein
MKYTSSSLASILELAKLNGKHYKFELNSLFFALSEEQNKTFRNSYFRLLWRYLLHSPFLIAKEAAEKTENSSLKVYGETPLLAFARIAEKLSLKKSDTFVDLGMGRGILCFWASTVIGCKTIGIESIEDFVLHAKEIADKAKIDNAQFFQQDLTNTDLSNCTFLYFYGLHLPDEKIYALQKNLNQLPSQAKVVSISFPLAQG